MADAKISGLTALTAVDAAADLLVIVDASDTSMAVTGTDKKATSTDVVRSTFAGTAPVSFPLTADQTTAIATGDGQGMFLVPAAMNTMELYSVLGVARTAGTTGTMDIQLRRRRSGADVDMLSTKLTWDSTEPSTATAAAAYVINTSNDDLATGDIVYVDVDAVQTTPAQGVIVVLEFRRP